MSFKKLAAAAACIALSLGGVLAAAPAGAALAQPPNTAETPNQFVSLSYGPHGVAEHQLALDVEGQDHAPGTPIVAWQSDEYQGVTGRVDPAEQFNVIPVTYGTTTGQTAGLTPLPAGTSAYQLEWAPGGVASGLCVEDLSPAQHTHTTIQPCAGFGDATVAEGGAFLTGSTYQDFYYENHTAFDSSDLVNSGYGELEPFIGGPKFVHHAVTATGSTALNDSAFVNGGHVISWHANGQTNEQFTFRNA